MFGHGHWASKRSSSSSHSEHSFWRVLRNSSECGHIFDNHKRRPHPKDFQVSSFDILDFHNIYGAVRRILLHLNSLLSLCNCADWCCFIHTLDQSVLSCKCDFPQSRSMAASTHRLFLPSCFIRCAWDCLFAALKWTQSIHSPSQ